MGPPPAGAGEHPGGLPERCGLGGPAGRVGHRRRRPTSSSWSRRQIGDILDLDACPFDAGPSDPDRPRLEADGAITWRGRVVDVDREGLPTLDVIELPVTSAGVERGRYLLVSTSAVRRPDLERRQVAVTLADQAAAALTGAAPLPARPAVDDGTGRLRPS